MENASKALIMAGGILLGVLILSLMVTLFMSSSDLTKKYQQTKHTEEVQQFNVNYTKYIGRSLTIHEIMTIINFSNDNNVEVLGKNNPSFSNKQDTVATYNLQILDYNSQGYIKKISIISN